MPQVTLYLDDVTAQLMRKQAAAAGMPYSRWVANLIASQVAAAWPLNLRQHFGAFPDMPMAEPGRKTW